MAKSDAPIGAFKVTAFRCRCGHEWTPRPLSSTERPRVCPKCKSPRWDQPYKFRVVEGVRVDVEGGDSDRDCQNDTGKG